MISRAMKVEELVLASERGREGEWAGATKVVTHAPHDSWRPFMSAHLG